MKNLFLTSFFDPYKNEKKCKNDYFLALSGCQATCGDYWKLLVPAKKYKIVVFTLRFVKGLNK